MRTHYLAIFHVSLEGISNKTVLFAMRALSHAFAHMGLVRSRGNRLCAKRTHSLAIFHMSLEGSKLKSLFTVGTLCPANIFVLIKNTTREPTFTKRALLYS